MTKRKKVKITLEQFKKMLGKHIVDLESDEAEYDRLFRRHGLKFEKQRTPFGYVHYHFLNFGPDLNIEVPVKKGGIRLPLGIDPIVQLC